ncbi:MAG: hypothetical protein R3C12_09875 [Planctomycetaceae bacterium]
MERWENRKHDPDFYPAGSWGPAEADRLLEKSGQAWHATLRRETPLAPRSRGVVFI